MLDDYWPSANEVNACIKNEAETADVSVLLAVHQPTPLVARAAVSNRETQATEKQLLDTFMSEDVPSGYILCPITGPSGAGKSHVIRWLDAQLQRHPRYDRLVVIRIPKSASLRKVVELILEPLKDNPRFAKPREDLNKAVAEVDAAQVIVRFAAELKNVLLERAKEMRAQVEADPSRGPELRSLIAHAEKLPGLFLDAVLGEHYAETVFSRIVERAIKGRDEEAIGGETDTQFTADDLLLPDSVDLSAAAFPVRTFYSTQINVVDPSRREPIAKLLNSVVDRAIGHVFRLEQASGGMTLQDIILGIRESLREEGKELVLLVEDFAALAGIQEALLHVCIQEGTRDGRQVYATMRTALALTDGYLTSRETITTRAQRTWMIGNANQSEAEIKDAAVEMVGAYLNAARWGEKGLKNEFGAAAKKKSLTDWLSPWEDEQRNEDEDARLEAFGRSKKGYALFPFNRKAIERLVAHHLVEGGRVTFNPRRVINEILRNTLLDRDWFVRGEFPPANYHGLQPNMYLAGLVRQASAAEPVKKRLQSALTIWGGDASDPPSLAKVPPLIFQTFGLPTPEDLTRLKYVKADDDEKDETPTGKPDEPSIEQEPEDPHIVNWTATLERWATRGEILPQANARELRNAIAKLLTRSIDWARLRVPVADIKGTSIWIAGAASNPSTGRVLKVCTEQKDEDGSLREAFIAVLRFDKRESNWDYPQGDEDYVAATELIDDLRCQLEPQLVAEAKAGAATIGNALLMQARILGMEPPVKVAGAANVLSGLFDKPPQIDGSEIEPNWDQLRTNALLTGRGEDARFLLQDALRDRSASYQGSAGRTAFAIDASRIFDVLTGENNEQRVGLEGLDDDVKLILPNLGRDRVWQRMKGVLALLEGFRTEAGAFLTDDKLDKAVFVADLKEIIALLNKTGCWPGQAAPDPQTFQRSLVEFQTSPFAELVSAAGIASSAEIKDLPKVLNAVGAIDLGLIKRTLAFLNEVDKLVTASVPRVERQQESRRQSDPAVVAQEIKDLLSRVAPATEEIAA